MSANVATWSSQKRLNTLVGFTYAFQREARSRNWGTVLRADAFGFVFQFLTIKRSYLQWEFQVCENGSCNANSTLAHCIPSAYKRIREMGAQMVIRVLRNVSYKFRERDVSVWSQCGLGFGDRDISCGVMKEREAGDSRHGMASLCKGKWTETDAENTWAAIRRWRCQAKKSKQWSTNLTKHHYRWFNITMWIYMHIEMSPIFLNQRSINLVGPANYACSITTPLFWGSTYPVRSVWKARTLNEHNSTAAKLRHADTSRHLSCILGCITSISTREAQNCCRFNYHALLVTLAFSVGTVSVRKRVQFLSDAFDRIATSDLATSQRILGVGEFCSL